MQINEEYKKWRLGKTDYTESQYALLQAYDKILGEVEGSKIFTITEMIEDLLNVV